MKPESPPGLCNKLAPTVNYWKMLEKEDNDIMYDKQEQRKQDFADLSATYAESYPKNVMGNYSKGQVKQSQNGEKKVKFTPINKSNAKLFPLNMMLKEKPKTIFDKPRQDLKGGENNGINYEGKRLVPNGGHYCPGHDATCRGLSAGGFKSPGGRVEVGTVEKKADPCVIFKPNTFELSSIEEIFELSNVESNGEGVY